MPRTNREIAEFMNYYNGTDRRQWALEHLSRVENKTQAEIRSICERYKTDKGVNTMQRKFSDELKESIFDEYNDGIPAGKIADKYHLTESQVRGIAGAMQAKEKKKAAAAGEIEAEPEYKYLEKAEKAEDPADVPLEINYISHFETEEPPCGVPTEQPEDDDEEYPEDDGADMFEMLNDIREFVENKFGEHIPLDMRCDNRFEFARYHFRDIRTDKEYCISVFRTEEEEEEGDDE